MRMLLETTMPTIITTPISDMTLSVVPVAKRMINTPVNPVGTASKISNGSRNDLNCATRIKYTSTVDRIKPRPKLRNETCMACAEPRTTIADI